jgi:hypothetical protein
MVGRKGKGMEDGGRKGRVQGRKERGKRKETPHIALSTE